MHVHPVRSCQICQDARRHKQPAGPTQVDSTLLAGQRFHVDFGFMRASTPYFATRPKATTDDRVVTSHDGYNASLLITDSAYEGASLDR